VLTPARPRPPHPRPQKSLAPQGALDPGLVYDAGDLEAQRYLCAVATNPEAYDPKKTKPPAAPAYCAAACAGSPPPCAWPQALLDYNQASFSLPRLRPGRGVAAKRTVTFVGPGAAGFTAQLALPKGYKGEVSADGGGGGAQLSFAAPGEAKAFTLRVTATRRAARGWSFGALTWADDQGRWAVRSTIALQRA
jgi:hypothetical protein